MAMRPQIGDSKELGRGEGVPCDRSPYPLASGSLQGLRGFPDVCLPQALRLHPAFDRLNLTESLISAEVHQRTPKGVAQPILATTNGIVISGVAEWYIAVKEGRHAVDCTKFELSDDEALILT